MATESTLKPWLGAIISKFVSGLFHGSLVGGGTVAIADTTAGTNVTTHNLLVATLISAIIGAIKDVGFYINANPMPNIFAQPIVAPVAGPVATPSVSDQPATLVSPTNEKPPLAL